MKEALLWYDNDPRRSLAVKVEQAAARYRAKFGRRATVCWLNEADLNGHADEVNGIRLQTKSNVLRHHYMVGEDGEGVPQLKAVA